MDIEPKRVLQPINSLNPGVQDDRMVKKTDTETQGSPPRMGVSGGERYLHAYTGIAGYLIP